MVINKPLFQLSQSIRKSSLYNFSQFKAYYSEVGSEYNIGRINIGGCDFSDRPYTYCDTEGDINLDTFDLAHDDLLYKIPYIQMAKVNQSFFNNQIIKMRQEVSSKEILLFGSAWSAPGWMKSNGLVFGQGYLLPQHYQLWADYHLRFLQAYKVNLGVNKESKPNACLLQVIIRQKNFIF